MSHIIWKGKSLLDHKTPIMVCVTGHQWASENQKTGNVLQTWILTQQIDPLRAVQTGKDSAICGNCPLRGHLGKGRTCYVTLYQAPRAVYERIKDSQLDPVQVGTGRIVRLGSYGDPAAVPFELWASLVSKAKGWLGYTHQWRTCDPRLKQFCMASVESLTAQYQAHMLGWRCFRIGRTISSYAPSEFLCPASAEAGRKLQCAQCQTCNGLGGRKTTDVFIPVHGAPNIVSHYQQTYVVEDL
jgi:hypothetical protein